jgi:hypothetical protein
MSTAKTVISGDGTPIACLAQRRGPVVPVMPGQGHVAMDTGTELFTAEVIRLLEVTTT